MRRWLLLCALLSACSLAFPLFSRARAQEGEQESEPAPLRWGFVGLHGGVFGELERCAAEFDVLALAIDERLADSARELTLTDLDALFLQHPPGDGRDALGRAMEAALAANPKLPIYSLSGGAEDAFAKLAARGGLRSDPELTRYYDLSGEQNLRGMVMYTLKHAFGREIEPPPPQPPSELCLFSSARGEAFADVAAWRASLAKGRSELAQAPVAAVVAHRIHRLYQQPKVVDALVDSLGRRGFAVAVVDDTMPNSRTVLTELAPDVVVHTCHSFDDAAWREKLDAPHLHSVFFRRDSIDDWRESLVGFDSNTLAFQVMAQELIGGIEPLACAGTEHGSDSPEALSPILERVERLASRAWAWSRLRRKPNADKRIVVVYFNREMGKGDLLRGSATGMFLNGPRSFAAVLARLAREGYDTAGLPTDEREMLAQMIDHGRQIGRWAPEELDRLARSGHAALVPENRYRTWFEECVTAERRAEVIERWGEAPGDIQVWTREDGERFLVVPMLRGAGDVVLLPQPLRGEAHDTSLAHDRRVPPSHNYLATYFWIQREFGADAIVHFGTHGTEFFLPGRATGLAADDWTDVVLGDLPNIAPWTINNLGEALPAKRRGNAVLIGHMVPLTAKAGLSDGLATLHEEVEKFLAVEPGVLRERFRTSIEERVRAEKLDRDMELRAGGPLDDPTIERLDRYLHSIQEETTPLDLHVFGAAPPREQWTEYLTTCLGGRLADELARLAGAERDDDEARSARARKFVAALLDGGCDARGALAAALVRELEPDLEPSPIVEESARTTQHLAEGLSKVTNELEQLVRALSGRFIPPGPGATPDRNPAVLPTGRNLFTLDPEQTPSRPSWEVGVELVDELLAAQRAHKGAYPRRIGFTLSPFATFQDFGVMEAQILYLLGVRPVWDSRARVADVELIPASELGRPRIDVFLSTRGYYRDLLPTRMRLIDAAVRRVAQLDEPDNYVFENTRRIRGELLEGGADAQHAETLSFARMFGYAPGEMGVAGYYYLVERSADWDSAAELVDTYLEHVQFAYTDGAWGVEARDAFGKQIQGTDVILRSWVDRTLSPLSNKYDWYEGGSLSRAVERFTGREPEYFFSDVRDPARARMVRAEEALAREYRVRLFNRRWLEGMKGEGYAGADQIATHVKNTFGWSIFREKAVDDSTWEQIVDTLVRDKLELGLREWFERDNPHAYSELTEILLEAARKGYWNADPESLALVAREHRDFERRFGESGGMMGGGNVKLDAFVADLAPASAAVSAASAEPNESELSAESSSAPAPNAATSTSTSKAAPVRGAELVPSPAPQAPDSTRLRAVLVAAALLVAAGFLTRFGAARSRA
jgi:cobaltochelatase CobN